MWDLPIGGLLWRIVWDERNQRDSMARDRLGIKPLFYAPVDGGLLFAIEYMVSCVQGSYSISWVWFPVSILTKEFKGLPFVQSVQLY